MFIVDAFRRYGRPTVQESTTVQEATRANSLLKQKLCALLGDNSIDIAPESQFLSDFFEQDVITPPMYFYHQKQLAGVNKILKSFGYVDCTAHSLYNNYADFCLILLPDHPSAENENTIHLSVVHELAHGVRTHLTKIVTDPKDVTHGDWLAERSHGKVILSRSAGFGLRYNRDPTIVELGTLLEEAFAIFVQSCWSATQVNNGTHPSQIDYCEARGFKYPAKFITYHGDNSFDVALGTEAAMALELLFDFDPALLPLLKAAKLGKEPEMTAFLQQLERHFGYEYALDWLTAGYSHSDLINLESSRLYYSTRLAIMEATDAQSESTSQTPGF